MPMDLHGEPLSSEEWETIQETIEICKNLSRTELAATLCEHMGWYRANHKAKVRECLGWLDELSQKKRVLLPEKKTGRPKGKRTQVPRTPRGEPDRTIHAPLSALGPLQIRLVKRKDDHQLWNELIDRYHYLGYTTPYGASLKYIVTSSQGTLLACALYSSPARRLQLRDQYIGWTDLNRQKNLQKIVQNSRFLILPWIKIPYLASHLLSKLCVSIRQDWRSTYGIQPVLLETFVDNSRYKGTCYHAANWTYVGNTCGRGRMDKMHLGKKSIKSIWVYPLVKSFRRHLI